MTHEFPSLSIPARSIPVPSTVSDEAGAILAITQPPPEPAWPEDLTDKAAVARTIEQCTEEFPPHFSAALFGTSVQDIDNTRIDHAMIGEASVFIATPASVDDQDPRAFMAIHGAWIYGAGEFSRLGAAYLAEALGVRVWAVDYRMPPLNPYPIPLDDCMTTYRAMIERYGARNVAIGGTSGGGNLSLALLLRAKREGVAMPAAAVVNTPYADLTHSGDTFQTLGDIDISTSFANLEVVQKVYLDGHDRTDPLVSPAFGEYSADMPPTLLCTGTRDFLLSDTVRVHRRMLAAGIDAELHVWEAAPHYQFMGTAPEDHDRDRQARTFLAKHLKRDE